MIKLAKNLNFCANWLIVKDRKGRSKLKLTLWKSLRRFNDVIILIMVVLNARLAEPLISFSQRN